MELTEAVRRRHMVRSFSDRPVDGDLVTRLVADALAAPTAGHTRGTAWLVLAGPEETALYWDHTTTAEWRRGLEALAGAVTRPGGGPVAHLARGLPRPLRRARQGRRRAGPGRRGGRRPGRLAGALLVRRRRVLGHDPPVRRPPTPASAPASSGTSGARPRCSGPWASPGTGGSSGRCYWATPTGRTTARRRWIGPGRRRPSGSTSAGGDDGAGPGVRLSRSARRNTIRAVRNERSSGDRERGRTWWTGRDSECW